MFKKTITYLDLEGDEATEDAWFHLTKADLLEMQITTDGEEGYEGFLKKIIKEKDSKKILAEFKRLVLAAYGIRSEDGKKFHRSPEISEEFSQTEAYSQLLFELFTDAKVAGEFATGLLPMGMKEELEKLEAGGSVEEDDGVPLYQKENREPTPAELQAMSKVEMQDAFAWKMREK